MKAVLAVLLAALALVASSAEDETPSSPIRMQLSPEQANTCQEQGGCIVITKRALMNLIQQACQRGMSI